MGACTANWVTNYRETSVYLLIKHVYGQEFIRRGGGYPGSPPLPPQIIFDCLFY